MPGWAWGFNTKIVQTVNGLYVPPYTKPGFGINFIARDLLESTSLLDTIDRASRNGQDGGSHFNFAVQGERKQFSIETSWEGTTIEEIEPPWYGHFNNCLHTDDKPHLGDYTSSIYRMARVSTLATRSPHHF